MTNPLHNLSTLDLADEYGALKGQVEALEKRLKALKDEMIVRTEAIIGEVRYIEGARFTVSITSQTSRRLDTKRLKEALGADICADYETETSSDVVRVKPTVVFGQAA